MLRPFKQPLLKRVAQPVQIDLTVVSDHSSDDEPIQRPAKKRRLIHAVDDSPPKPKTTVSSGVNAPRKPLLAVKNQSDAKTIRNDASEGLEGYYMVLWYDLQIIC
jgi:hypothetical protein